jgi:hypothetical protein
MTNSKAKLRIYQIYYTANQKNQLDHAFTPYFKPEDEEPEWREYWTFRKNAVQAIASKGLTGYVSWKFPVKSGVSGEKFRRFVEENPGFDVYFINPFPLEAFLFDNVWKHGDFYHPNLTVLSASLLAKAGYAINIEHQNCTPEQMGYSNYWVGNSRFWKHYMAFTLPLEQYIRKKLTPQEKEFIYSIADQSSNCSHIPFIFERMFTTLLVTKPEIRAVAYTYDRDDLKARYSVAARMVYSLLKLGWFRRSPAGWLFINIILLARKVQNTLG